MRGTGWVAVWDRRLDRFIPAHAGNSSPHRPMLPHARFIPAHAGNRARLRSSGRRAAVHPRACGEQTGIRTLPSSAIGSSPRMRGTVSILSNVVPCGRFIPAHAGNRSPMPPHRRAAAVHPRACGEQQVAEIIVGVIGGSSPRMRGTGLLRPSASSHHRFIPAHAGNRVPRIMDAMAGPVHPRACGEQVCAHVATNRDQRFIPAHAGNRALPILGNDQPAVHPRACGEQSVSISRYSTSGGSSPRMRGTVRHVAQHGPQFRFIPAHAGNRVIPQPRCQRRSVHPRACGEQRPGLPSSPRNPGSSPRMRGTDGLYDLWGQIYRFIPAHAGNSQQAAHSCGNRAVHPRACGEQAAWYRSPAGSAVHPRACGEQIFQARDPVIKVGSSPRMRGTAPTPSNYCFF
ncbi:hypothetical protein DFP89_13511 [Paracoccus lutimaris]|uniref:Uncharacterized protein n=1 Tax=Paracoccus lutimaris TaxID=1490030 RepID=A0A368YE97_9RHOB|nr:hypothetical protein DFP89_13511 [Paracoccus lutimaris]